MMIDDHKLKYFIIFLLTILIGMILTIIPLPHWAIMARPQWVVLLLVFWLTLSPLRISTGTAFIIGLLLDLLTGTLLGQHALAFCLLAYVVIKLKRLLTTFPIMQQTLVILLLAMFNLAVQYWIMALAGMFTKTWAYWLSAPATAIIWPWLTLLLRSYRYQLKKQW